MSFPNRLHASWPRGTGTEPAGGAGPRTCPTPSRGSDRLLCEDKGAARWFLAGAQPGSPGGIPGPTPLANQTCCSWDLANLPSQPPRAGGCPLCPVHPTGYDPGRPRAATSRTMCATTPVGSAVQREHGSDKQTPPRFWSTNGKHSHPCGQLGPSTALPGKAGRSPITSTGSTLTTGNCSLSTEIQQKLFFWVLVRLQVTASSHNIEHVIKVTWKMAGYIQNTDQVFPVKKKKKQYNTENQFVLISTFQIPLTLCYTPALSAMLNSAKERIKDVQTKQEPRDMLLCADTQLHRETTYRLKAVLRSGPSSFWYWKHGLWFVLDACIVSKCMHLGTARELPCKTAFITEKKWLIMLKFQLWKANNPAAKTDEGTCSGVSVL